MKHIDAHLAFTALADLIEARLTQPQQEAARAHLAACAGCSIQAERLDRTIKLMRADAQAEDAPPDGLAFALNVFRALRPIEAKRPSLVRRMLAALTFDSAQGLAPAFGVRSAQSASAARQLLYSADDLDLDLRVAPAGDAVFWALSGQVLGAESCVGGAVELDNATTHARAELNEMCEFVLPPVPSGNYTLRLRLPATEIEVNNLTLT